MIFIYSKLIAIPLFLLSCFCITSTTIAQVYFTDTVSVANYNVNNYGFPSSSGCPLTGSPLKHQYLKTVIKYMSPDIISFEKINGTPSTFSIDTIKQKIMDSVCLGCYSNAAFTNVSGYQKVNSLFYKNIFNLNVFKLCSTCSTALSNSLNSVMQKMYLFSKRPENKFSHENSIYGIISLYDLFNKSYVLFKCTLLLSK